MQLHDRIRTALNSRSARWHEGLAGGLAAYAWCSLARARIDPINYGTARVLQLDPAAPRMGILIENATLGRLVPLECYDTNMLARYGVIGLHEPRGEFKAAHFETGLARATQLIDVVPGAGDALRALVWSITPLSVEGPAYDTGYSDPKVPFSIFVGAHSVESRVPPIRLAESVLHEVMHLQLSIIEQLVPLVCGCGEQRYSPWQGRERPTQGVLHGLYVFRVIQDWFRVLIADPRCNEAERAHAQTRILQIDEECSELSDLADSEDLTGDGRMLAQALSF